MRILVIGGTGFLGPHVGRILTRMGHQVAVLHRGVTRAEVQVEEIIGDREDLGRLRPEADVVVDLILSSGRQARALMDAFRGRARRIVAASSMDVYRACGILHGSEDGPLQPVPLTEESELRTRLQTYPPAQIEKLRGIFGWLDDEYDKIPVERAVLADPGLPGTVVRLPMIYGPGDRLHRFYPVLKRIDDGRRAILFEEDWSRWRSPRGYVENAAAALALGAVSDLAAGRVYHFAETPSYSEIEWAKKIVQAAGGDIALLTVAKERMPAHLMQPGNSAQHWEADSTRIRNELGYSEPVAVDEAVRRTVAWERENAPGSLPMCPIDYDAEDAAISSPEAIRKVYSRD
jgi:nucleoside-diphosphate-sugar epimerase